MQQWLQFVIPLLFVLVPIVGQIYRWSQNQAQERAIREERAKRQREALRTGRATEGSEAGFRPDPTGPEAPARPAQVSGRERLQELQAKRRAEIEARIRERRAQGASARLPTATAPAPTTVRPGPARPTQARPSGPTQARPTRTQPTPRQSGFPQRTQARSPQPVQRTPQAPQRPVRPAPQTARGLEPSRPTESRSRGRQQVRDQKAQRRSQSIHGGPTGTTEPVTEDQIGSAKRRRKQQAAKTKTPGVAIDFTGMSREDWRKAILMREVLGTPVGARAPGEMSDPLG